MGLRAGLDRCGKSRPTGIRSPDRPARRQSLYRLRYPALKNVVMYHNMYEGSHNNKICMICKIQKLCNKMYYSPYFSFFQENNLLDRIRLLCIIMVLVLWVG